MNIVDLYRKSKPTFIMDITTSYGLFCSSSFNQKFDAELSKLGYIEKLRDCNLTALRIKAGTLSRAPMIEFQGDPRYEASVYAIDVLDRINWSYWIQNVILLTCERDIRWGVLSFSIYSNRIVIRLYANQEDRENFKFLRRILIVPSLYFDGLAPIEEVWP